MYKLIRCFPSENRSAARAAPVLLPIFFVCWFSFFGNEILSFPPEGYTLKWFTALWLQPQFADGFGTSLEVALLAMVGGLAVGIPASLALVRTDLHEQPGPSSHSTRRRRKSDSNSWSRVGRRAGKDQRIVQPS
jgi:hypothetical protein